MTQSNRTRLTLVREATPGVTPASPRMRSVRMTGEGLTFTPTYVDSDEIRPDRMNSDPILVMKDVGGTESFESSFPDDNSPLSELYRSAFFNPWANTPARDNDGVADSVITAVAATGGVVTVTTGAAFVAGHLVRLSGFGQAANNGVFPATTGSATVPAFLGVGLVDEAAPAAAARMKVVGLVGASGDITAVSNGLGSTTLDFTTFTDLVPGRFVKIGGSAVGDRFATAALNGFARIVSVAAHLVVLDNLPAGWATDTGTGKTIKVWFGDQIKNGVTQSSVTLEKGFLGQAVPTFLSYRGMTVGQMQETIASRAKVTGQFTFTGIGGTSSTTSLDVDADPATIGQVMAANANVGRISDAGAALTAPNWCKSIDITINNNLRTVDDASAQSPAAVREGECTVTGSAETYFGDKTLLDKYLNGVPTSLASIVAKNGQAIIRQVPRATYRSDGNPQATAKNTDVMLKLGYQASYDALTNAHVVYDRLEYYEA